ncbi:MAG: ROK family transcriptional regulator [Herpetosiphonaceae bacterium]|nr:ROK family transcriptional regulator [Herpetosiphonaceae bacterium]
MTILEKATREHTKVHNRRLILRTIYDQGAISRVDISRMTQLTRTTVSANVSEMLDEGLVEEVGTGESVGGKPPTLLSLAEDSRHLIGLDLASGTLRGAVISMRGKVRHQASVALPGQGGEAVLAAVYQLIDQLIASTSSPILGIGIGAPGIIDAAQGMVRQAVNLDWRELPLRTILTKRYSLPVHVANDSHVAAIAEYTFGVHKNVGNLVVVKIGRGIGMGMVLNGRLFYGDGGGAGEIGHVVVVDHGTLCRCGSFGCLETVASSQAIIQQARTMAHHQPESKLHALVSQGHELTMVDVVAAHHAGDTTLQPIITNVGRYLGSALAFVVGTLNINHVIIAGTVAGFGQALLEPLNAQLQRRTLATLAHQTMIEQSTLGPDIVTLGAAALLLAQELGLNQFP